MVVVMIVYCFAYGIAIMQSSSLRLMGNIIDKSHHSCMCQTAVVMANDCYTAIGRGCGRGYDCLVYGIAVA